MNVLFVIASLGVGGTEKKVVRVANYFADVGINVTILSLSLPLKAENDCSQLLSKKVKLDMLDTNGSILCKLKAKSAFNSYVRKYDHGTDGSFCIFYFNYYPAIFIHPANYKQYCFINTGQMIGFMNRLKEIVARSKMKFADKIISGNSALVKNLSSIRNGPQVDILPNGIETICPKKANYNTCKKFKIVIVAGLRLEKKHSTLFQAVKNLKEQGYRVEIDCIGQAVSEELHNKFVNMTKVLSIENEVNFLGLKSNVRELLPDYDCFVLPSNDTFSNALLEAMCAGLPCIGANMGGTPEIITDYIDGLLFQYESATSLSLKIKDLIENENLRVQLGKTAIKKVDTHFSNKLMMENYLSYLYK